MPNPAPLSQPPPAPESSAPVSFSCALRHSGRDAAWIGLRGQLDVAAAPHLASRLEDALGGARLVVVDLRKLSSIDGGGLSVIVSAHHRARRSGRRLLLVRGPDQVHRLITGVQDRLEIADLQQIATGATGSDRVVPHAA